VASQAARRLVPVTMELDGKSAIIVFPDADLAAAAAVASDFTAAGGESCVGGCRALVHESIYDDFIDAIAKHVTQIRLRDLALPTTDMGPLCTAAQLAPHH
jgi:(Z)-2-((N-methylformamido)methylene)-5-hydroxybutyrolactone dehydrogenase